MAGQCATYSPTVLKKDRRPGETALIEAIRSGTVDRVAVSSICRIGRSLTDSVAFMETCRAVRVGLYLHEQNVLTDSENGTSLFDLSGMLAFHLRQMRRDRILRGQAAVRGVVRIGRPPIPPVKLEKAKRGLAAGKGVREVARMAGISAASVSRLRGAVLETR
jgi:DNA invertase Pin-like site-specific DNA recombinase